MNPNQISTYLPSPRSNHRIAQPIWKPAPKKRRRFMTLILALKTENGVVMAADSQYAHDDGSMRTDAQKIREVRFKNHPVLIGFSDNVKYARRYISLVEEMAADVEVNHPSRIGELLEAAMLRMRHKLRKDNEIPESDMNSAIQGMGWSFSIVASFVFKGAPHIIRADLTHPTFDPVELDYDADGSARDFAYFLLNEYYVPGLDLTETAIRAVHVLQKTVKFYHYCDPPFRVWYVTQKQSFTQPIWPEAQQLADTRVEELISITEKADAGMKTKMRGVIANQFAKEQKAFMRWLNRHEKEILKDYIFEPPEPEVEDRVMEYDDDPPKPYFA